MIGYISKTAEDLAYGWIGHPLADLTSHLFVDSSLGDCPFTLKSCMGSHFDIQEPSSRFPIAGGSNSQTVPQAAAHALRLVLALRS